MLRKLHDPIFWNDLVQLGKTVVAAVLAWVLAASVLGLSQPFLAPWSALLVVHATVYRTFSRGAQQVAATVVAVVVAAGVAQVLGLDTVGVAVVVTLGLLLGAVPWFGDEALTVATTGLIVLTTGVTDDTMLIARLLDTGVGVAVGLLVNLAVWPPLRRRTAIYAMNRIDDRIGELLEDIGASLESGERIDVEDWVERTRDLDAEIGDAWALVRQARESAWMNPRREARQFRDPQQWHGLLRRMEQAVAETRSMARTLGAPATPLDAWEAPLDDAWTALLIASGRAIADADAGEIRAVRQRLETLVRELNSGGPLSAQWPVHGALVINLRNILDAMDEVAVANPLDEPPRPLDRMRWRAAAGRADRALDEGRG